MTNEELCRIIPRDEKGEIKNSRMKEINKLLVNYKLDGRDLELLDLEIRIYKKYLGEKYEAKRLARESGKRR